MQYRLAFLTMFVGVALLLSTSVYQNFNFAFGQFFENSANGSNSQSGNFTSTDSGNSNNAEIVLLSQKLKKASSGYRDLIGQVQNIGNDTATSVKIGLNVYGKDGGVIGTDTTYAEADALKPGQKSTFSFFTSADNFKGMSYYELTLEWDNSDSTQGYVENAQIYKQVGSGTSNSDKK